MTRPYVSLHNHTIASLGDSLITPKELIETTAALGQTAVAITDHGVMGGLWDALKASKKSPVKLIAGCECYFAESLNNEEDTSLRHIILLATNKKGYQNLLTLNKLGFDNFAVIAKKSIPRITWDILQQYSEGIVCTTACGNGIIGQWIMKDKLDKAKESLTNLQKIFGDRLYIELQPHNLQIRASAQSGAINQQKINLALKKLSQELGIQAIVATDAHYVKKEHHRGHDVYLAENCGQPFGSGNRLRYDKHEFYIKSSDDVFEYFKPHLAMWGEEFVESLFTNTVKIADQCEKPDWIDPAVMTGSKSQLPDFPFKDEPDYTDFIKWKDESGLPDTITDDAKFYRYRSQVGLDKKIEVKKIPETDRPECLNLMSEEFDVLEYRGFSSYMLITADFLAKARSNNIITGPGRGSVGGSLTAYVNDIHKAYPKKYGLIFARFLNKFKDAYPDIDNDIASSGREWVYNYICQKYGHDNVAHVSNIMTITPTVYVKDIARVFEFGGDRSTAAEIGQQIADILPSEIKSVKQALEECEHFAEYAKQYPELAEFAELLGGKPRAVATHAGGIVIGKQPLTGLVPLRRDTSGALVLEYEKERAEENGLVKIDLLGVSTLDVIDETYKIIKSLGKPVPDIAFDYEMDDAEAYKLLGEGDTFGVFQLGATAVPVCKKVLPKNVADIALISSLVRPASKDIIPDLLKVRNGDEELKLLHPSLKRAFENTYGFGLFEESLMYIAQDVAGWDLHDADKLRKMTKEKGKNPLKVKQWKEEFVEGAMKKHGFDKDFAEELWSLVEVFNGYGFNKSVTAEESVDIYTKEGSFIDQKQIQDIQAGDYVRSRDETTGNQIFVEALALHDHGELPVVEIELDTGERVRCTMNHKFRVKENGAMLPLWEIIRDGLSIVVTTVEKGNIT